MADRSKIEWTDASWNPIRARWFAPQNDGSGKERVGWHCEKVSAGCQGCYAETFNRRLGTGLRYKPDHLRREVRIPPTGRNFITETRGDVTLFLDEKMLLQPLRWGRPRMIFVGSMTDLFADFVTDAMLDAIFAVMAASSCHPLRGHTFQVLTKRPARMRAYLTDPALPKRLARAWCHIGRHTNKGWTRRAWTAEGEDSVPRVWPLPNVWIGTSCEDQATADARLPDLLATPAAVRFVSAEPLLGPIDFDRIACPNLCHPPDYCNRCHPDGGMPTGTFDALATGELDQIIVGGESGPKARPMHLDWARSIRDQCAAAGVPFFFKQWGEWLPLSQYVVEADAAFAGKVGKRRAGRLLDGVEHNDLPHQTEPSQCRAA